MTPEPKEPLSKEVDRSPESITDGVRAVFGDRGGADDQVFEPGMEPDPDVEPVTPPDSDKPVQDIESETAIPTPDDKDKEPPADKELSYDEAFAKMNKLTAETEVLNTTLREKLAAAEKHEKSLNQEMTDKTTMMKKLMDDLGIGPEYDEALKGRRDVKKVTGEMPPGDFAFKDYMSDKIFDMVKDKHTRAQIAAMKNPFNMMLNMMVKTIHEELGDRYKGLDERVTGFETLRDGLVSSQQRISKWKTHLDSYDEKYGISKEQKALVGNEMMKDRRLIAMVDTADEALIETTIRRIVNDPGMAKLLNLKDIPETPPEKVPEPALRVATLPEGELPQQSTDIIGRIFRSGIKDKDGQVR